MLIILSLLASCTSSRDVEDSPQTSPSDTQTLEDSSVTDTSISDTWTPDWTTCNQQLDSHTCDFTFHDVDDDPWSIYDHHGTVMVLDFSTQWCSVCRDTAQEVQIKQDLYNSQDFLWVTILIEDNDGNRVDSSEIQEWKDAYNITTAPVLRSDRRIIDYDAEEGWPITAWPTIVILNRDLIITCGFYGNPEEQVTNCIEAAL